MRIGVLGTGAVGSTIGSGLIRAGHDVRMGSRTKDNAKAAAWVATAAAHASQGTFADAAAFGEVVFNCTAGANSLAAIEAAGPENLRDRILIDLANPLDFSKGMPPSLTVCNTDSLGEQIQRALPATKVVKILNTVNCKVMVDPSVVPGEHNLFVCGNDGAARAQVAAWISEWFGWPAGSCIDLGDITAARAVEMLLPLWVRLYGTLGTPNLNFRIMVGERPVS